MQEKNSQDGKDILDALGDMNEAIGNRFDTVDKQLTELRGDVDFQFRGMREQLDRIENDIIKEHARRIEALEQKIGIKN